MVHCGLSKIKKTFDAQYKTSILISNYLLTYLMVLA